ncbi:MAG: hypothetical protein AAGA16_22495 [Cyanobacteria bacterium P01_E01_bin.35]
MELINQIAYRHMSLRLQKKLKSRIDPVFHGRIIKDLWVSHHQGSISDYLAQKI